MSAPVIRPLAAVVEEFERAYLVAALRAHGGSRVATARTLRVSRKTLWQKQTRYEIGTAEITPPTALPARVAGGGVCAVAEVNAARRVLEAAAVFVDGLVALDDDDDTRDLVEAVLAWRRAQAEHATATAEALEGVTT